MTTETAAVQLPKEMVEALVRDTVSTHLATALASETQIARSIVALALNTKVDDTGKVATNSYYNTVPFVEWMVRDAIRRVVREVMEEELEKFKPQIREQMIKSMQRKNSPFVKQLVDSMLNEVVDSSKNKYRLTVNVKSLDEDN